MTELERQTTYSPDNIKENRGLLAERDYLMSWTLNTPEVHVTLGKPQGRRNRRRYPIDSVESNNHIIDSAITTSVDQYFLGMDIGFYPISSDVTPSVLVNFKSEEPQKLFKSVNGIDYHIDASLALMATHPNEQPEADEFANVWWKNLTTFPRQDGNGQINQPQSYITAKEVQGVPAIICRSRNDFDSLKPYNFESVQWSDDIQAFSFIVTESSRPYVGTGIESMQFKNALIGSLWIVGMESCLDKVLIKHVDAQSSYATNISYNEATPLLITRKTLNERIANKNIDYKEAIDILVRDITLQYLVTDRIAYPSFWDSGHLNRQRRINNTIKRHFYIVNDSPFETLIPYKERENVSEQMAKKLNDAFDTVNKIIVNRVPHSKLGHLIIANTLAHYPLSEWGQVSEVLLSRTRKDKRLQELKVIK